MNLNLKFKKILTEKNTILLQTIILNKYKRNNNIRILSKITSEA